MGWFSSSTSSSSSADDPSLSQSQSRPQSEPALPPPPSPSQDEEQTLESRRPRRSRPRHDFPETQASKLWKALGTPSGGPVNEMPGGTYNSAGGKPREPTWRDAFKFEMFTKKDKPAFYQQPCARDALLVGICVGGGRGGLRFILSGLRGMWMTTNWAVGGFTTTALGMFYWCQERRKEEARGMAAAVAGMKMLHEKRAKEEAEQRRVEAQTKQMEEETRIKQKRWYKPWT